MVIVAKNTERKKASLRHTLGSLLTGPGRKAYVKARMFRKILLACGMLSSLLYIGRDLAALLSYPSYDFANQVISELSAVGVPSRGIDVAIGRVYGLLMVLFGVGTWLSARNKRGLRITGVFLAAAAIFGSFWPPMHMRGAPTGLTDTLHIVWTAVWLIATMIAMGFAGAALGKRFFYYTIATVCVMLLFGALTGLQGPHVAANLPTPWIGIYERINIGAFLLWVVVLAVDLWPIRFRKTRMTGDLKHA